MELLPRRAQFSGAHSVTAVLAFRLERLGWITAQAWLRMQAAYDLAEAKQAEAA